MICIYIIYNIHNIYNIYTIYIIYFSIIHPCEGIDDQPLLWQNNTCLDHGILTGLDDPLGTRHSLDEGGRYHRRIRCSRSFYLATAKKSPGFPWGYPKMPGWFVRKTLEIGFGWIWNVNTGKIWKNAAIAR